MSGINLDEWLEEIERLRPEAGSQNAQFLPEHDAVLVAARSKDPPVPWPVLSGFARSHGWPAHNPTTLRNRLKIALAALK